MPTQTQQYTCIYMQIHSHMYRYIQYTHTYTNSLYNDIHTHIYIYMQIQDMKNIWRIACILLVYINSILAYKKQWINMNTYEPAGSLMTMYCQRIYNSWQVPSWHGRCANEFFICWIGSWHYREPSGSRILSQESQTSYLAYMKWIQNYQKDWINRWYHDSFTDLLGVGLHFLSLKRKKSQTFKFRLEREDKIENSKLQ